MHRRDLLEKLRRHQPFDAGEGDSLRRIESFVRDHPDCFERTLSIGHITGSAWLLDESGTRVLLTHHRKLNKWLQLGGHAEGDPDILAVALREAREESGLSRIEAINGNIYDVDVHLIPALAGEAEHYHYDVRFLLTAVGETVVRVSDESHDLAWVTAEELPDLDVDESVLRMHRKWLALATARSRSGPQ